MSHVAAFFVEKTCFTIKLPFICSFVFWMIQHKNVNKVYTCHFKYKTAILNCIDAWTIKHILTIGENLT